MYLSKSRDIICINCYNNYLYTSDSLEHANARRPDLDHDHRSADTKDGIHDHDILEQVSGT